MMIKMRWKKGTADNIAWNYKFCAGVIGFFILLLFLVLNYAEAQMFDAAGYETMADEFVRQGIFNFHLNLENGSSAKDLFSLRAYAWPFLIAAMKVLGFKTKAGFLIWWSAFLSFGLSYVIPEIFEELFHKKLNIISRVLPEIMTIIFFPGLLTYLLSDIPATIFSCLGILLIMKTRGVCPGKRIFILFFAGLVLGVSYYIRTGSSTTILIALVILILLYRKKRWQMLPIMLSVIVGIMISAVPQAVINKECNGKLSYEVPIAFTTNIMDQEYYNAVSIFRYETNVSGQNPNIALMTKDNLVKYMLVNDNITPGSVGPKDLLIQFVKHPFEFLGILITKMVNYIDPRYGEIYIKDLSSFRYGLIFFNLLIWFVSVSGILYQLGNEQTVAGKKYKNRELQNLIYFFREKAIYVLACIAPALLHLIGTHVEPRYIYPIYLFVWQYLFSVCPIKELMAKFRERVLSTFIIFTVFLGSCWSIWNFTFQEFPYAMVFYQKEPQIYDNTNENFLEVDHISQEEVSADVSSFKFKDNILELRGYMLIQNMDCDDTKLSLVLENGNLEYFFGINASERYDVATTYGEESYLNSGIYFRRSLWDINEGTYNVIMIAENNGEIRKYEIGKSICIDK